MPKLKTHRGAAKRFNTTGSGKVTRKKAYSRHILTARPRSRSAGCAGRRRWTRPTSRASGA